MAVISYFEGFNLSAGINLSLEPLPGALNPNWMETDLLVMPGTLLYNLADPITETRSLPFYLNDSPALQFNQLGLKEPGFYFIGTGEGHEGVPLVIFREEGVPDVSNGLWMVQPVISPGNDQLLWLSEAFQAGENWSVLSPQLQPGLSFTLLSLSGKSYQITIGEPVSGDSFSFTYHLLS